MELRQPLRPASRPFIHAQVDEALGFGTPCWAAWTPGQLVIDRFARILASFLRALPQPARTPPGKRRLKSASLRCLEIAVSHADCLPCRPVPLAELAGPSPCLLLKMSLCLLRWYLSVPKACAVHAADPRMCEVALPHKVIEIRSVQSMYYCLDTSSENVIGGASPRSRPVFSTKAVPLQNWLEVCGSEQAPSNMRASFLPEMLASQPLTPQTRQLGVGAPSASGHTR